VVLYAKDMYILLLTSGVSVIL